jgi:hypothetical protein
MKKNINLTDDLDSAFNKAIESMEIEPSESVWKNVDAGLTQVENSLLKRKIIVWKKISVVISFFLVALGILFFYHYSNHELSNRAALADRMIAQPINPTPVQQEAITPVEKESSSLVSQKQPKPINTTSVQKEKNIIVNKQSEASEIAANNSDKTNNRQNNVQSVKEEQEADVQNAVPAEVIAAKITSDVPNQPSLLYTNKAKPDSVFLPKEDSPKEEIQQIAVLSTKKNNVSKDSSLLLPPSNEMLTETSATPIPSVNARTLSRFYVEGIFSPEMTSRYLKDNNTSDIFTSDGVKNGEVNIFSHSEGIKFGYDLNRWSIQSGCIYYKQSLSIKPTTMYPYESNGQFQCSLVTSSGTVDIPYYGSHYSNDSMTVKSGSYQSLHFLNIPLQFKYKFGGSKMSFYVLSGISANILIKEETSIKIDREHAEDDDTKVIREIKGTKNVYYGYSLGAGASYRFRRGFYLSLEPALRGAMSSLNKNTPIKTYPYTLGVGVIAGYHF